MCTVKNKLTKSALHDDGVIPVYSSESSNNGIVGYTNYEAEFIINEDNPIYIVFGDHTRSFNIATKSFCVMDNVKVLAVKDIMSINVLIFIVSSWKKSIPNKGYSRHWSIAKSNLFTLPIKDGKINFSFMEEFIAELEAERLAELEAYLTVTNLKDYTLTQEEQKALDNFEKHNWEVFKISEIFEKLNLKNHNKLFDKLRDTSTTKTAEFSLPLVNAKLGNNGIMFYGREKDFDAAEMTIDVVSNGAVATGTVYAQPKNTGVLWDAYLLKPIAQDMSKEKLLYMATSLQKAIKSKFGWEDKAVWSKVQHETISLPLSNKKLDYRVMETFISAIQKLVIKDVVVYADEKINATKRVVNEKE